MRVLIVNRFFGGAQIPTGRMAKDVALMLVEAGHEVIALASSGEYVGAARRADGIQHTADGIRSEEVRVPKWMPRALAWVWFTRQAQKRIPRMDWDVCVLMTDPPLLPLLANGIRRKAHGIRHIAVWLMDLYPEALAASGRLSAANPLYRWFFDKRQRALGESDLLLFLGETQRALVGKYEGGKVAKRDAKGQGTGDDRLETKRPKDEKPDSELHTANSMRPTRIAVVPPWDDRGNIVLATKESLRNLALYAGNLGEAHCFEEILAAAAHLPGDWTIRFAVRGAKLAPLKAAACGMRHTPHVTRRNGASTCARGESGVTQGATVEVTGYASEAKTPGLLASARVHLITMSPGWEGIVVPSKLYGCISTGRPVLFIGPENADTAREIRQHDWGKVLPPGASGQQVAAAILELARKPSSAAQVRNGARFVADALERLAGNRSSTAERPQPVSK